MDMQKTKKFKIIIVLLTLVVLAGIVFYIVNNRDRSEILNYKYPNLTQEEIKPFLDRIDDTEKKLKELSKDATVVEKYQLYMKLASEYYPIGEYAKAKSNYLKASELADKDAQVWYSLSNLEVAMHDYRAAKNHIQQAILMDRTSAEYWRSKIEIEKAYFTPSDSELKALYIDALSSTNYHPDIISVYANYLESKDDLVGAVTQWRKAIERNPDGKVLYDSEITRIQNKLK